MQDDKTPDQLIPEEDNSVQQKQGDAASAAAAPANAPAAPQNQDYSLLNESAEPSGQGKSETGSNLSAGEDAAPLRMTLDAKEERLESIAEAAAVPGEEVSQADTALFAQDAAPEPSPEAALDNPPDEGPADSKLFSALSWITPLLLLFFAALLFIPLAYDSKVKGLIAETGSAPRLVEALTTARQGGGVSLWIIPQAAGEPVSEVLPMQLWWGAATESAKAALSDLVGPWLAGWVGPFFIAWLFLMAVAALGWTDSRFRRRAGLAAGLAAFCGPLFICGAWLTPDLLLAPALSTLAAACLLRGLKKKTFSLAMFTGGVFMGLAGLSGGLIFAAMPLFAALFAIVGAFNFRRLGEWDLVFGIGLTVLVLGGWFTGGLLFAGSDALRAYLGGMSILAGGGYVLPVLPVACLTLLLIGVLLPWVLLPFCLPVRSGKAFISGLTNWKDRTRFTEGLFLTGLVLGGLAVLFLISPAHPALLLSLAAGVSAIAARSLTSLSPAQSRRWGVLCAFYLLLLALGFAWFLLSGGEAALNGYLGIEPGISFGSKTWLAPAISALIGVAAMLLFGKGKSSQGGLLIFSLVMLLVIETFAWLSLPMLYPSLQRAVAPQSLTPELIPPADASENPYATMQNATESGGLRLPFMILGNATSQAPAQNATLSVQPDILGVPLPQHNSTLPATPGTINGSGSILPGSQNATSPGAQNATVPDAGGALYGDDLNLPPVQAGPPPAPYQPGLHREEPPLPILDAPGAQPRPPVNQ